MLVLIGCLSIVATFVYAMVVVGRMPPPVVRICANHSQLRTFDYVRASTGTMRGFYHGQYMEFTVEERTDGGKEEINQSPAALSIVVSAPREHDLRALLRNPEPHGAWSWPARAREEERCMVGHRHFTFETGNAGLNSRWFFTGAPRIAISDLLASAELLSELHTFQKMGGLVLTLRDRKLRLWRLGNANNSEFIVDSLDCALRFITIICDELPTYMSASARRELDRLAELRGVAGVAVTSGSTLDDGEYDDGTDGP
jgi:hypothetical protein